MAAVAAGIRANAGFVSRVERVVTAAGPMALMPVTATTGVGGIVFTLGLSIYRVAFEA